MANNNRNQGDQHFDQDWDNNRFNRQNQNRQDWNQQGGYGDQLKGGYGGSEFGNTYYKADYNSQSTNQQRNQRPEHDNNKAYSNQQNDRNNYQGVGNQWGQEENQHHQNSYGRDRMNYGNHQQGNDYNPGGYARVGNTGSSFNDMGNYNQYQDYDRRRNYGSGNNQESHNQNRGDNDWWDRAKDKVSSWFDNDDDQNQRRGTDNRSTGEHRGKGPRGYQRSADRIREDICDRLSDDPYVDASDIDVKIEGSEVVLSGTVHSKEAKRRAEDIVESISGVRTVENRIRVDRGSVDSPNRSFANRDYTGTSDNVGGIGNETGTTNEIIRNAGNMRPGK